MIIPLQEKVTVLSTLQSSQDMATMLRGTQRLNEKQTKKMNQLRDLLDKCLRLDPSKRIGISEALSHPFIMEPID